MMDTPDHEFDQLLAGHANATLTGAERARLDALCAADAARAHTKSQLDALHAAFAAERALRAETALPVEPIEEADEGFARLAQATARAEDDLRARLRHTPTTFTLRKRKPALRLLLGAVAAIAAAALVAAALGAFDAPPALHQRKPAREVLGGEIATIVIAPRISRTDRTLSWSPVWQAHDYAAVIVDGVGKVILERAGDQARSTRWELTADEFEALHARQQDLRLRVQARDGLALPVATSGDLPLVIE